MVSVPVPSMPARPIASKLDVLRDLLWSEQSRLLKVRIQVHLP
jgi:hypothetical protein